MDVDWGPQFFPRLKLDMFAYLAYLPCLASFKNCSSAWLLNFTRFASGLTKP